MAPMKRQRESNEDEEFDALDVESAQSSLRQDSRKKSRLSHEEPQSDGSEDLTDQEVFEEQATQYLTQQQSKQKMDNEPADNGIIESIICENFMCHSYLEVLLGPLLNFIIGHNGSGKSAILTAITICLGGKATATNRGQSLKSFIKQGQDSSTLTVKIKNTSDSAYQHEVYGDTIVVQRHFSRSGSSTFRLKSSAGRLVSNRKADLDEICDYFALQIDNPMNVLTQDMARQFLSDSTPSDKYKFFMKGTQLEHLDGDYLQIEQNIDKIDQDLFKNLKDVEMYEEEANKARALLMLSEKHDALRYKIGRLSFQMAWAQVEEQEGYVVSFENELRKVAEMIENADREAAEASETFDNANQALERANAAVAEFQDSLVPIQGEKDSVKQENERTKAEARISLAEQRQIKDHLKNAELGVLKTEADIVEEHRHLDEANGGSHTIRLAEIEGKRADVIAAKNRLEDHEIGISKLEAEKSNAEKECSDSQALISSKRSEIAPCRERLHNLERDRGQQQGAYKANMPRLLSAIRQDESFLQKPIGPLGNHVRLLKPLWSSILERSFGATMTTFIVTSKQDQSKLSAMMQKLGCIYPILIGNNAHIDTSSHEPDSRFDTTLRVLEIDNDLVRKQLIINQSIEQTVLTERRDDGVNALEGPHSRNVKQVFTLNVNPGSGLRLSHGYGGGLSQNYIDPFISTPRMKTDIEYQINSQREIVKRLESDLNHLERDRREKQASLKACEQAIVRHRRESSGLLITMQSAQSLVEELQDALDRDAVEEGRLGALKDHLAEAREEVTTHEGSYQDSVVALDKTRELLKASKEQMTALDARIAEIEAKIGKADNKVTKASAQREGALRLKNAAIESTERAVQKKAEKERKRAEKVEVVAQFTVQANLICARVPVDAGETGPSLDKKLLKLTADLKRYEAKMGGDKNQIAESAAQALETYQHAKDEVEKIEKLAQLLKHTLVNRKDRWRQFQRCITARARVQFFYLLSERGFRGRLLANHKEKKLDLNVEPDETKIRAKGRGARTLSGGEKSFSTLCLLLSLWDAMGAPIRCLDEFDVFMDPVNRDVSLRLLIKAARRSIGKQYVLITPQSMGPVDSDRDVKIIKMSDPERGQTTISFAAAA